LLKLKGNATSPPPPFLHLCTPYLDWEADKPMAELALGSPHTQAIGKKEWDRAAGSFDT